MNHEHWLQRWTVVGLLDTTTAARIRAYEDSARAEAGLSLPIRLLIGLGGVAIAAGVLLFVAAHWDAQSPTMRFTLLAGTVAACHLVGGWTRQRFPVLAVTLHAVGTAALGGAIFLTAQMYHLAEHWPHGLLLWSLGAVAAWVVLRDWPQLLWAALLVPAWLLGEWVVVANDFRFAAVIAMGGLFLLAVAYAATAEKVLARLGHFLLLPLGIAAAVGAVVSGRAQAWDAEPTAATIVVGITVAVAGPLLVTALLARDAWREVALATLWCAILVLAGQWFHTASALFYLWLAVGAIALAVWGVHAGLATRVNLGIAAFALTVLAFYFSSVFDKLGRSASLLGLGLLLIGGGWALERLRRRLMQRMDAQQP